MLLIYTEAEQSILVGKLCRVKLLAIDKQAYTVKLRITNEEEDTEIVSTLKTGVRRKVIENVLMVITQITTRGNSIGATIGFEAPRWIIIRGEWMQEKRIPKKNLDTLPIDKLIQRARFDAQTELERALLAALELRINK